MKIPGWVTARTVRVETGVLWGASHGVCRMVMVRELGSTSHENETTPPVHERGRDCSLNDNGPVHVGRGRSSALLRATEAYLPIPEIPRLISRPRALVRRRTRRERIRRQDTNDGIGAQGTRADSSAWLGSETL